MRKSSIILALVALAAGGCASTTVDMDQRYEGAKLARPDRILVYDFAATPADIPAWSAAANTYASVAVQPSAEALAAGRKLGSDVAEQLVTQIRAMGLPAVRAAGQPTPRRDDIVIIGYFEAVDTGNTAKRLLIGFGSGSAEMKTEVEGYVMTDRGLRKLGSGTVDSAGSKGPGAVVPIAVTIATANPIGLIVSGAVKAEGELSGRNTIEGAAKRTAEAIAERLQSAFQRQGWI